jgi:signal transduction histidine kinase/CheY-like chemotaxis protein
MKRPLGEYLKKLDRVYQDQNELIRLKARLISGMQLLFVAIVVVNIVRIFLVSPEGIGYRLLVNFLIIFAVIISARLIMKDKIQLAGSLMAGLLIVPFHVIIALIPASMFLQPIGTGLQIFIYDCIMLLVCLVFACNRTRLICFATVILGNCVFYFKTLNRPNIPGSLDYAANVLARDGFVALTIIFTLGIIVVLLLEYVTKRSEHSLETVKAMNRQLEDRVTERTKALETATKEALAANKAKGDFLANMSHEIRTPLYGIIAQTELLKGRSDASGKESDDFSIIADSGNHLLRLIDDILDFSKIEANQLKVENETFTLRHILDESILVISNSAQKKAVEINFNPTPELKISLLGDCLRLKQVLINLLSNAVKFTPEGGTVTVAAKVIKNDANQASVIFSVSDTGIGMDAETKKMIFERFTQADSSTTRRFGGTGLGLAISSRIVNMMGGELSAESEIDAGSRFEFTLQFAVSKVAYEEPVKINLDYEKASLGLHVLVAEDNRINQKIICRQLDVLGCTYKTVSNGSEVIDTLNDDHDIELILMDCNMPILDGPSATQIIRNWADSDAATPTQKRLSQVPIIAFTATNIDPSLFKKEYPGMDDFIVKPARMHELHNALLPFIKS